MNPAMPLSQPHASHATHLQRVRHIFEAHTQLGLAIDLKRNLHGAEQTVQRGAGHRVVGSWWVDGSWGVELRSFRSRHNPSRMHMRWGSRMGKTMGQLQPQNAFCRARARIG